MLTKMAFSALALFAAACVPFAPSNADDLEVLKGKTIRGIIGANAGGGGDFVARAFFKSVEKALPQSTVLVQNVSGSGGAKTAKEVYEADGDAIVIGYFANGPLYTRILTPEKAPFDLLQLKWIGALMAGQRFMSARSDLGIESLEDARAFDRQLRIGTSDMQSPSTVETFVLSAILDLRLKVVTGMSDDQVSSLVMSGDLDLVIGTANEMEARVKGKEVIPLVKYVEKGRVAYLDGVPTLSDSLVLKEASAVAELMKSIIRTRYMFATSPAADDVVLASLRSLFDQVASDPEFMAAVAAFYVSDPTPGDELRTIVENVATEADVLKQMKFYADCGLKMSEEGATSCK